MKQTRRIFLVTTFFLESLFARAHNHTALIAHLKDDFGGYAMMITLMIWAIVELRKDASQSTRSSLEPDIQATNPF